LLVFKFSKNEKCKKKAKNAKNEVFEFKMSSIWVKKWTPWGAAFLSTVSMF
jgi:hypothetical protein